MNILPELFRSGYLMFANQQSNEYHLKQIVNMINKYADFLALVHLNDQLANLDKFLVI